jgi:hypothetical protein
MIGIANKIKTNEIELQLESKEIEEILKFVEVVTESCLNKDKEVTKFFI